MIHCSYKDDLSYAKNSLKKPTLLTYLNVGKILQMINFLKKSHFVYLFKQDFKRKPAICLN